MITTTDITLGTLKFNGTTCATPSIELVGSQNVAIKCIDNDKGIYRVQTTDGSDLPSCLTFIVSCDTCGDCPPKVITRCLCDTIADCDDCQDCVGGICVDRCDPSQICVNNTCVSCQVDSDCPCNQKCTPTGCQCPTGSTLNPLNNCCDFCSTSADCGPCSDCINVGGINTCVAKVCPDGVCDPTTGECVGCLTSGDCANKSCKYCDPILKRCVAGEGQVQVGNDCVVAPDCQTDSDCNDPCLACGPAGTCIPIQCPPGKVPARIGGRCECVEECDCDDPRSCSDQTKHCTAIGPDTCGCLPCEGDCASGCQAPCYCDPLLNKCVANPCPDTPCSTGLDCGPGCGCDNGQCKPCSSLSCSDSSCANVLGCKCAGLTCVADDCGNSPCTTAFDCPFGCTCHNGRCTGCSNFSCSGVDNCTQQVGCACVSGTCQGDPDADCSDVLALIKNDDQCSLTGSLSTETCCACSPLTLAVKGRRTSSTSNEYNIVFQAELRKGEYNGVNINANPLLDDVSNDNIAENEVPTSGTITYQAYTKYAIYKNFGSGYVFTGNSTEGPQTGLASYIGGTAIVEFPEAAFKKIGVTEQVDANTQREAVEVNIEFFQSSHLIAPNKCNYRAVVTVGDYTILSDDDWTDFDTSVANNGIATTVTSSVCRDPFFKWRKNGELFRKLYVSGSNNVYSDLLERPPVTELESCYTYSLEVDCSCEKSISDLVTFCNPADINFNITNCGKSFELLSFDPCGPNLDQEFFIKGGDLDITFLGSNPPLGTVYDSTTCIDELTYGLTCDPECTKTYINQCADFDIGFTTVCDEDGANFTVTFDSTVTDQSGQTYQIEKIVVGGFTLTSGTGYSRKLKWGTYTATVYPNGGCDNFEVEIQEDCCTAGVPEISRDCDGGLTCTQDPNVVYEVNGVIQTDICGYVSSLPADQSVSILIRKGSCRIRTITLPSLASFCCDNYDFSIVQQNPDTAYVEVYSGGSDVSLAVGPSTGIVIEQTGTSEFLVNGLVEGQSYTFTVTSQDCGVVQQIHLQTACALNLGITQPAAPNCNSLIATVTEQECRCKVGEFRATPTAVDASFAPNTIAATFETSVQNFDASVTGGSVWFIDQNGTETAFNCVSCVKQVTFPAPDTRLCLDGVSMVFTLQDDPNFDGQVTGEVEVLKNGINITTLPNIQSVQVSVSNTTIETPNGNGIFIFPACCRDNTSYNVSVIVTDTNGIVYTKSVVVQGQIGVGRNYVLSDFCSDGNDLVEVPLRIEIRDLALADNCEYKTIGLDFIYHANSETISPSVTQTTLLKAEDPFARFVKFEWRRNNSLVWTDFQETQSTLPEAYLIQGADFEATAYCDPCEATVSQEFCCLPAVSFTENAWDDFGITVEGLPGTYLLNVEGTPFVINLVGPGTTSSSVTYNGPLTPGFSYDVSLSIDGTSCQDDYVYVAPEEIIPLLRFSDCNPGTGTYEIFVDNALASWTTTLLSGTGTIAPNGVDLLQLDEFDPPVFQIVSGTVQSSVYVGTSPTSCFSSSTAFTSSSIGASSAAASSSGPASSSATSSIIPPSSTPPSSSAAPSSSNPVSSSNPISSASPPPSSNASSSNAAASSSPVASSSFVASSSPAPASSTGIGLSSCPTILEITQSNQNCTYTLRGEHPDTGALGGRISINNDSFVHTFDSDCVTDSSCEGELFRDASYRAQWRHFSMIKYASLQSGDVAATLRVFNGSIYQSIDISPGGHTSGGACAACGAVNAANLTYNGSNGADFAAAIEQAAINGIYAFNGYEHNSEYYIQVDFSGGALRIGLANKHNPVGGLFFFADNGGNFSDALIDNAVERSPGVGAPATFSSVLVASGNTLFNENALPTISCSQSTQCGLLSDSDSTLNVATGGSVYGSVTGSPFSTTDINTFLSCGHAELVATLTGGSCTPTYAWTGPGTIYNPAAQTIYVTTAGSYEVDVTGCSGCGTLEDSETVV